MSNFGLKSHGHRQSVCRSSCVCVNCPSPWVPPGSGQGPVYPCGCGHHWTSCFSSPLPRSLATNHSLLGFCFFGFDGLRFDRSSSHRFGGHGGDRGWLFFSFFLTDAGSVGQRVWRLAGVTVCFLGLASSYLFALLLLREEPLRGLKNLCSLLGLHVLFSLQRSLGLITSDSRQ